MNQSNFPNNRTAYLIDDQGHTWPLSKLIDPALAIHSP
jgi:hypothetical protein